MKKLVNFRPIFYLAIASVLGVLTGYYFDFYSIFVGISLIAFTAIVLTLTIIFSKDNKKAYAIFSVIFALIFALGFFNYTIRVNNYEKQSLGGHTLTVSAKVYKVNEYDSVKRFILKDVSVSGALNGKTKYRISLYAYGNSEIDLGDRIIFTAKINDNPLTYDNRFRANDVAEDIKYSATIPANEIRIVANESNIFEKAHIFIRDTLRAGLNDNEFSVAYAMLLGNTDTMSEDVLDNFRALGIAHVFAVSGLHIGFIATIFAFILKHVKLKSIFKILITALAIFFYAGVCGFSASSIRAGIMSVILLSVNFAGKKYDRLSSLSLACLIILFYSPIELFKVGFILSFIVVFGIITCSRIMGKPFKRFGEKFSSLAGGVLSAQLFSLPVCLISFGKVGALSVIANLILLPIIGFVFIFLLISVLIGGIFSIAEIALFPIGLILKAIIFLSTIFDYGALSFGGIFFGGFIIFYYLFFFVSAGYINLTKIVKTISLITLAVIFVAGSTAVTITEKNKTTLTVMGEYNCQQVLLQTGGDTTLFVVGMDGLGSTFKTQKATAKTGDRTLERVVFLNGTGEIDFQHALTEINKYYEIESVFVYAESGAQDYSSIVKSFPNIAFNKITNSNAVAVSKNISFNYFSLGKAVSVNLGDRAVNIYSNFSNLTEITGLEKCENSLYVVAYNHLEIIESINPNAKAISFLSASGYLSAQNLGNIIIEI